jgi:hypothetical protein
MSGSPLSLPAIGASEAIGGGAMALWRQAQAQMAQQVAQAAPPSEAREEAAQPALPASSATQQPATPMRLSELRLDATHLAMTLPPRPDASADSARRTFRDGRRQRALDDDFMPPDDRSSSWGHEMVDSPPEHWLAALARRWTRAESLAALRGLQLARTQWACGRRVLLVCGTRQASAAPGTVTEAPAWASLLMGRAGPGGLVLDGTRWPVRLMWVAEPPAASRWFCSRMVKEAAPGQSWQMTPCPEPGETRAAAALQIGPGLAAERRWSDLGVRLDGGNGFRAALGSQWSLWLMATRGCWMDD